MDTDKGKKVIKKGVSLYPSDWEYLQSKATYWGMSVSATIRHIIRGSHAYVLGGKVSRSGDSPVHKDHY